MKIWAYVILFGMFICGVTGLAVWYKGTIDDAWKAKLDKANAEIQQRKDAAKVQTANSNTKIEVLHAKLEAAVKAVQTGVGCASTPLPLDAVAIWCDLRLLDAESCARLLARPGAGPTAPAN